jgi:hypothetical protein
MKKDFIVLEPTLQFLSDKTTEIKNARGASLAQVVQHLPSNHKPGSSYSVSKEK